MALVPDQKFSTFQIGGAPTTNDIIVGLRDGINTKFTWTLPAGVNSLTGTAMQVLVNGSSGSPTTGDVILTLPQDIAPTSSPEFANLQLTQNILDSNGNIILGLIPTASAVNFIEIFNNATGLSPSVAAVGSDADVRLFLSPQGDAGVTVYTSAVNAASLIIHSGTAAQHTTSFLFANTATNQSITFPDATGTVALTNGVASSITGTANQVLVNGTSGTAETGAITLTLPQSIGTSSSPEFDNLQLTGDILDVNGNILLAFTNIGSPTAYLSINNSTANPGLSAAGSASNINVSFSAKGTGIISNFSQNTSVQWEMSTDGGGGLSAFSFPQSGNNTYTFPNATGTIALTSNIPSLPLSLANGGTGQNLTTVDSAVFSTTSGGVAQLSTTLPSGLAATNMTLTTPILGTPQSGTLTNCTGLPISGLNGLGTGVATALGTNVNGSGAISLTTSPTFVTPTLGNASATSLTLGAGTTLNTYSNGTWTPTWTNLTIVGTPTYFGTYVRIGAVVHCWLQVTSTTSTASTIGSTSFTGLPYTPSANSVMSAVNGGGSSIGTGIIITSGTCYTPTWAVNSDIIIYFAYQVSTN